MAGMSHWRRVRNALKSEAGFGLVEVMVALLVVTMVALTAQKLNASVSRASAQKTQSLLAHLCAENAFSQLRLKVPVLNSEHTEWPCQQAHHIFAIDIAVQATANPQFNKVVMRVREADASVLQMVMILKAGR